MTTETLAQVRDLVRSLTTPEKRLLLSDLTAQLLPSAMQASSMTPAPFPTFPATERLAWFCHYYAKHTFLNLDGIGWPLAY